MREGEEEKERERERDGERKSCPLAIVLKAALQKYVWLRECLRSLSVMLANNYFD